MTKLYLTVDKNLNYKFLIFLSPVCTALLIQHYVFYKPLDALYGNMYKYMIKILKFLVLPQTYERPTSDLKIDTFGVVFI